MTKPLPTLPNVTNPGFLAFCNYLKNAPVQPAGGLAECDYVDHLRVLEVPVSPQPGCNLGYCWYNCLDQQVANGGQVIYGWSLWQSGDCFIAQHHAIWQNDQGQYLDVTPNEGKTEKVFFMPDNRAPFDIELLRAPASLEWCSPSKIKWFARLGTTDHFFIARMQPTEEEEIRISRTRQRLADLA